MGKLSFEPGRLQFIGGGVDMRYISGTEITGANSWSISIDNDTEEALEFGDRWKTVLAGGRGWGGAINAYLHIDSKVIHDAAVKGGTVPLLIYPDRDTLTSYYSGNAIFGLSAGGSTTGAMNRDGDFVGDGTLTATGFSA